MVTRMLEELGLFVGERKMADHEPYFFLGLNDWIIRQCGGAWDHPEPIHDLLESSPVRALVVDYLYQMMLTPRVASYLGWKNFLRYRTPFRLDVPWGWKDPRNTFTLPLWLELFPDAKVVHVYRNGVDVVGSLKAREEKSVARAQALHERRNTLLYSLRPKRGGFVGSLRCGSLEGGFTLWESYLDEAKKHVADCGQRAFEIKYEDLLSEPFEVLSSLVDFCELSANGTHIAAVSKQANRDRALAYKEDRELRSFAAKAAERLAARGY